MVRQVNSPQTHCGQTGDKYEFLLGLEDSKRDSAECASLLRALMASMICCKAGASLPIDPNSTCLVFLITHNAQP